MASVGCVIKYPFARTRRGGDIDAVISLAREGDAQGERAF
jgi:hypothetical protein